MMETTPRTRNSTRYRQRVPTPKMSERKKKLFDDVLNNGDSPTTRNPYVRLERLILEEGEDSDLGPMSPLEFSSSPSSFHEVHRIFAREPHQNAKLPRTDFTNILNDDDGSNEVSQSSSKKKSPDEVVTARDSIWNGGDDDMMGPLCNSMKKLSSMTEQNYEQQLKTPSDVTTTGKSVSEPLGRNATFRKSLVFDSKNLTPNDDDNADDDDASVSCASKSSDHHNGSATSAPKAKTSLTFNEPTISVRSFYGKSIDKSNDENRNNALIDKINLPTIVTSLSAKHKRNSKSRSKPKSLSKRMKAASAPSLWRFSGKTKFNHRRPRVPHKLAKRAKLNTSTTIKSTNTAQPNDVENIPPASGTEFTSRIEQNLRLQKILKEQPNALSVSREINWIGSSGGSKLATESSTGFLNSDSDGDEDSENEERRLKKAPNPCTYEEIDVEVDVEEPTNRKFFKSSASNSAKKYRIMGRLSATVKRGGDMKFDPPPKRKKKRINKGEETVVLHNEITSIIDRLSSPSKNKSIANGPNQTQPKINGNEFHTIQPIDSKSMADVATTMATTDQNHGDQSDFIDQMQTEMANSCSEIATVNFTNDIEKYRRMVPYNTSDPEKMSQQESILELLISNGICDDETFKIFIAEPDLHKEKASQILDSLYCVNTMISTEYENEVTTEWVNSVESLAPGSDTPIDGISGCSNEASAAVAPSTEKLFPIFNKNFQGKDPKVPTFNALQSKAAKDWIPIGDQQYQLDVGQKEFGLRTCAQCEMQYSVHEPEDELLHVEYHNRVKLLTFKGWSNERVVTQIDDWIPPGRIIYVCESDSKAKKDRCREVLAMIDRDLGFATPNELKPKTLVYFAIVKEQIVGVCVVQPLERAHRMKTENGIDCYTTETYPVKCGVSRIWVAPQYRRHGIAVKLITSMRGHFLFGAFLSFDEIAFSSPTEDGKRFAASLAQRNDFLIYES